MECLRQYLNNLSESERKAFALRCKTSLGYLRKAISANQELGTELSVLIETESGGAVTRKCLHPRNWVKKWPELAQQETKK